MIYAEYYRQAQDGTLHPTCGDRSVYILDGRNSRTTQLEDAAIWGKRHGHHFFRLMKGDTFNRSSCIDEMRPIR